MLAVNVGAPVSSPVCPSGKIPYVSHDDARQQIRTLEHSKAGLHGRGLEPYRCSKCGAVHLTSASRGLLRERKRRYG